MKCAFEKDVVGFYITPLIGFSKDERYGKALWVGWGRWLFVWSLNRD